MANAIELAKSYVPLLDEVYAREVLTSDLDARRSWCSRAPTPTS